MTVTHNLFVEELKVPLLMAAPVLGISGLFLAGISLGC